MSSSSPAAASTEVGRAIARLDRWFETMHGPGGYGGPISHWWESSLLYCGPMADWRYEGIICGYVELERQTGNGIWLERATRAASDLLAAQMPDGTFRASAFQQGPIEGGTPHEAAVDVALLEVARLLRDRDDEGWRAYLEAARRNIDGYLLGRLWNGQGFRDQPSNEILVANKNATVIEALILFEALSGRDMSPYLDAAAAVVHHARMTSGPLAGATVHAGTGRHRLAIGIYTARSMAGLLRLHERRAEDRVLEAVAGGIGFLRGLATPAGYHFGKYPDGRLIANPLVVAGTGDILRLFVLAEPFGITSAADVEETARLLLRTQRPNGSVSSFAGLAARGLRTPKHRELDFRDVLPVVGWTDKAFRGLCLALGRGADDQVDPAESPAADSGADAPSEIDCVWLGRPGMFAEDAERMTLADRRSGRLLYRWWKGTCYPDIYLPQ